MPGGLKWARRLRLDLGFEIEQLASSARTVTLNTASGPVDVTEETPIALRECFEHVENLVDSLGTARDA